MSGRPSKREEGRAPRGAREREQNKIYTIKVGPSAAATAAAAPADRMRPTEKHAKIPLDSDVFGPRPTGRSATAKK